MFRQQFKARQQGTGQQLPYPGVGPKERGDQVSAHAAQVEGQRQHKQRAQQHQQTPQAGPCTPGQQHQQGVDEVILLFNGQRPQVQQGFEVRLNVEIPGLLLQHDVLHKTRPCSHVLAQQAVLLRQQHPPTRHTAGEQHGQQRREDAPHTVGIKRGQAEMPAVQLGKDDAANEVARDDEKHVNADKAALECSRERMEHHHDQHGNGAQAVDVGAVVVRCGVGAGWVHGSVQGACVVPRGVEAGDAQLLFI